MIHHQNDYQRDRNQQRDQNEVCIHTNPLLRSLKAEFGQNVKLSTPAGFTDLVLINRIGKRTPMSETGNNTDEKIPSCGIALAGASGSHPDLLRTVAKALSQRKEALDVTVIDMSPFDRRGTAAYEPIEADVFKADPGAAGIRMRFATAAPNIVLAGGNRAFDKLIQYFEDLLTRRRIAVLLVCHSWGLPEQALIRAARALGVTVFQIDEGPFSLPLRGTKVPETSRGAGRIVLGILRRVGLMPPRDMSGDLIDRVLATAPGRVRQLRARGVDPDKIVLVPPPRFDRLADVAERWPKRADNPKTRVLWLHQPFRSDGKVDAREADRAERLLIDGLNRLAEQAALTLRIRFHPRTADADRARLIELFGASGLAMDIEVDTNADLYRSILESDAAVGFYSSGLLEAAVCGMPTVSMALDPTAFSQRTEAAKSQAMKTLGIPVADSAQDLSNTLGDMLRSGSMAVPEKLIEEEIGHLDGTGASTVAELLSQAVCQAAARPFADG